MSEDRSRSLEGETVTLEAEQQAKGEQYGQAPAEGAEDDRI